MTSARDSDRHPDTPAGSAALPAIPQYVWGNYGALCPIEDEMMRVGYRIYVPAQQDKTD